MNSGRMSWAMLLLLMAVGGCISIPMDSTNQYKNIDKQYQRKVTSLSVDRIEPESVRVLGRTAAQDMCVLKLYAVGKFIEHNGYQVERVNIGKRTLTVGLWPGMAVEGNNKMAVAFLSIFGNLMFVVTPTLSSLLVEPFRDYYASKPNDMALTDAGLIGFRKHYCDQGKTAGTPAGFRETDRKNCDRVALYGFSVEVDGVRYKSVADGVVIIKGIARGGQVRVKVVEAPSVSIDSTDKMTELVGAEFDLIAR